VGRFQRKRPLGSPRRKLEDNIKMDLQVVGWGGMAWIYRAQDMDRCRTLVNALVNRQVSIKCGEFLD
jgi:hypothetical protein